MVTSITNLYRLSVHAEAEVSLPKVHMLRKEPLSVSLSHYMGVRDQGLFNWPTDYSAYALSLPPFSCRLSEAFLFSGLQVQRDQSPATRASFVCFTGLGNGDEFVHLPLRPQRGLDGALGETWAQISLTAGEAYGSELISNWMRSGKIQHDRRCSNYLAYTGVKKVKVYNIGHS